MNKMCRYLFGHQHEHGLWYNWTSYVVVPASVPLVVSYSSSSLRSTPLLFHWEFLFTIATTHCRAQPSSFQQMAQQSPSDAGKCLSSPPGKMTQASASAAYLPSTEQMSGASATDLLFGGELYADLLGFAGPEAIAHIRDDPTWRRAMDELPDVSKSKLCLPVLTVPRPSLEDRRLLRELLTEPVDDTAESGASGKAGDRGTVWKLNSFGLQALAASPLTSNEMIKTMVGAKYGGLKNVLLVASRPSTNSQILSKMAPILSKEVHRGKLCVPHRVLYAIAQHCNATSSILSDVLLLLVKSDVYGIDMTGRILEAVACHRNTCEEDLKKLSSKNDYRIRQAVAANSSIPEWLFHHLASDDDFRVRAGAASNVSAPLDFLQTLAADKGKWVRCGVACNSKVDVGSEIIAMLACDNDFDVVEKLGTCRKDDIDLIFSVDNKPHRKYLAKFSKDGQLLERLIRMDDGCYQEDVACNAHAPSDLLKCLARSEEDNIRAAVAKNSSVPSQVVDQLSRDISVLVRENIAANASTSAEVLESMVAHSINAIHKKESPKDRVLFAALTNKKLPLSRSLELWMEMLKSADVFDTPGVRGEFYYFWKRRIIDAGKESRSISAEFVLALSKVDSHFIRDNAMFLDKLSVRDIVRQATCRESFNYLNLPPYIEDNPLVQIAVYKLSHFLGDDLVGNTIGHKNLESWW